MATRKRGGTRHLVGQLCLYLKSQRGKYTSAHKVYSSVVNAVKSGALVEPFSKDDFRAACPCLGHGTYNAFLDKHSKGNLGGNSELFERESAGRFKCLV